MAVRLTKNPYNGINAHHLSLLQSESSLWESFHGIHITHLWEALRQHLPAGYLVRSENSIQLVPSSLDQLETGKKTKPIHTRPDLLILQVAATSTPEALMPEPTATLALEDTLLAPEEIPNALLIYEVKEGRLGKAVTRIELLSPTNKPPHPNHRKYLEKRTATLLSGLSLIELDYLHQTPSVLTVLPTLDQPAYPADNTYPYSITITIPYPTLQEGKSYVYGFHVDEPVPLVPVPLTYPESFLFDFGAVYQHTFELDDYAHLLIDYSQPPENFSSYHPTDQAHIQQCMNLVQAS